MVKKLDYAALYTLRKDGRYMGYWHDDAGCRHAIYDRDPEQLYRKIEMKESRGPEPLTFRDIAEAWHDYAWETVARGTTACYASSYQRALDEMGDMLAADVTAADVTRHLERLKKQGLGSKSVKTQRTVYRQIFQYAINTEPYSRELRFNPVINVPLPRNLPSKARQAPEEDAVAVIRSSVSTARWGLFPMFLICTGCRKGEALGVKWSDVDYKKKTISIRDTLKYHGKPVIEGPKTEAGIRTVPLLPDLEKILIKPENAKPEERIFHGEESELMPEKTYQRKWLAYCKDTGFVVDEPEERVSKQGKRYIVHHYKPTLTAHVLRHSYATMLFEAEVDVYTAQKLLGHADIRTTMEIYTHLRQKKKAASLEKLTAYVNNGYMVPAPQTTGEKQE